MTVVISCRVKFNLFFGLVFFTAVPIFVAQNLFPDTKTATMSLIDAISH